MFARGVVARLVISYWTCSVAVDLIQPVRRSTRGGIQVPVLIALAAGAVAGLGAFTFRYAQGAVLLQQ